MCTSSHDVYIIIIYAGNCWVEFEVFDCSRIRKLWLQGNVLATLRVEVWWIFVVQSNFRRPTTAQTKSVVWETRN